MTPIRNIVFDLGGVLIDYDLQRSIDAFRALGFMQIDQYINPYRQSGVFLQLEEGKVEPRAVYDLVDREVGHHVDERKIDAAWCSFLIDIPDYKLDMLLDLRRKGYRVFMLSNTNTIMFEWMKKNVFTKQGLTVDAYFDRLFLSYEMKLAKPGEAIFRTMLADGDMRPGETLLIDDGEANVEAARASVATAQLTYDSKKELFAQNVISEFDLQTSYNNLLTAKAQLAQTEAQRVSAANNLSYTEVKSPADGVVGTLPYRVGALVSASLPKPLTTVSDNSDMYVYFSMTENQLLDMTRRYGSRSKALEEIPAIELILNDKSTYPSQGKIETISGVIDTSTGTVSLRAVFPNKEGLLQSGGAGNVVVPVQKRNCIVVPQAATYEVQDKVFVFKVVDGKAQSAPVEVTRVNGGKEYIVDKGLNVGDVIVAEGVGLLREGTPIQAKEKED